MRWRRGAAAGRRVRLPQDVPGEKPLHGNKGRSLQQRLHNQSTRSGQSWLAVARRSANRPVSRESKCVLSLTTVSGCVEGQAAACLNPAG